MRERGPRPAGEAATHLNAASFSPWWCGANCTSTTGHLLSDSCARVPHRRSLFLRVIFDVSHSHSHSEGARVAESSILTGPGGPVLRLLPDDNSAIGGTRGQDLSVLRVSPIYFEHRARVFLEPVVLARPVAISALIPHNHAVVRRARCQPRAVKVVTAIQDDLVMTSAVRILVYPRGGHSKCPLTVAVDLCVCESRIYCNYLPTVLFLHCLCPLSCTPSIVLGSIPASRILLAFFSRLCQHFAQYILPHIFHSILIPESSKDADYSILILCYPTENRGAENQKNFGNHWPWASHG